MNFRINNIEYSTENELTIFEFLRQNKIFLPSYNESLEENLIIDLACVEVEGYDDIVKAKKTYLVDGMNIYTNSKKVHEYLYDLTKNNKNEIKKQFFKTVYLDNDEYNVLMCQPECFSECMEKYKDSGFNDIISTKIAQMLVGVELAHEITNIAKRKLDHQTITPRVILLQSILEMPKDMLFDIKPSEEVFAQLIKGYYKNILKIDKKIKIIYVTKSIVGLISHHTKKQHYKRLIDLVVYNNNFNVEKINNKLDMNLTNYIYKVDSIDKTTSCNYNIFFLLFEQMGFSEQTLEVSTVELGKELISRYKGFSLKVLITDKFLTKEDILALDYDLVAITTRKQTLITNDDEGFLNDYNLNQIYKKLLIHPGHSDIFKRG